MNISAVIMPATARPMPRRTPAIVSGNEPGSSTFQNSCRRFAPKESAICTAAVSTVRTALAVFATTMNTALRKITAICELRETPNNA